METSIGIKPKAAADKKVLIDQTFRDSVARINAQGKRNFIFPKKPKGRLYNQRTAVSLAFLALFFTLPFIKVEGEPLFLFNQGVDRSSLAIEKAGDQFLLWTRRNNDWCIT